MTASVLQLNTHVVSALFEAGAVGFNEGQEITFKSGIISPGAYINNRVLQSHPDAFKCIVEEIAKVAAADDVEVLASVATGGIAFGAAAALLTGKPHVIVKKEEKTSHGLKGLIDGDLNVVNGSGVLMVEDMSSTFTSTLKAMESIAAVGGTVIRSVAIETWGFPVFHQNTADHDVFVLCDSADLIGAAGHTGRISAAYKNRLVKWVANPDG